MWQFLESLLLTLPRAIAAVVAVAVFGVFMAVGCLWIANIAVDAAIPQALASPIGWIAGIKVLVVLTVATAFVMISASLVVILVWHARREPF